MKPYRCYRSPKIVEGLDQGIQGFVVFGQTVVFCHAEIPGLEVRIDVDRPIPGLKSFCVYGGENRSLRIGDRFLLPTGKKSPSGAG